LKDERQNYNYIFFPIFAIAQAPQKINFQSILRNTNGEVVANKSVSLKISILSGSISGSSVYGETHAKTTDASGLISLQIGNGTVLSGIFANIDWKQILMVEATMLYWEHRN
jgi:trimeric autotransporter adhesin